MRATFLFIMAGMITTIQAQTFTAEEMAEIKPLFEKGADASYNEHEGILWISSRDLFIDKPDNLSSVSVSMKLYFGLRKYNGDIRMTPLRFVNALEVPEWIFFNKISFLYGTLQEKKDGTRKQYELTDAQTQREVLRNGMVREVSDVAVYDSITEMLRLMISNPKPLDIQYSGDDKFYDRFHAIGLKAFAKKFGPLIQVFDKMTAKFEQY